MRLVHIENFRLIDRNKAGAIVTVESEGRSAKANYIFYLQSNQCLSIRLGLHDDVISTAEHEEFLKQEQRNIRQQVQPDVERVRQEARARLLESDV